MASKIENELQECIINYDLGEELEFNKFKLLLESMGYYQE